jgi:hypothetical protein
VEERGGDRKGGGEDTGDRWGKGGIYKGRGRRQETGGERGGYIKAGGGDRTQVGKGGIEREGGGDRRQVGRGERSIEERERKRGSASKG